jgi:hypothetical protein
VTSQPATSLKLVDGRRLEEQFRTALRPGELVADGEGRGRRLPRYFYEVPSWETALATQLTPHFGLWELLDVDFREAEPMRIFPRYVPCALVLLATHLEVLRERVGTVVRVAANGGYRSPAHSLNRHATTHSWGTAANIYRIGDEYMDTRERIEKYTRLARELLPGVWARPFGAGEGCAFDHVHLDLGFASVVPHDAPGEDEPGEDA